MNLCENLVTYLEQPTTRDESFKVNSLPAFIADFKLRIRQFYV